MINIKPARFIKVTRLELFVVGLIVVALVIILTGGENCRRQWHCCVICRSEKLDYKNVFGKRWTEFKDTESSAWYSRNIEPEHEHVWQRSTSMAGFDIFGNVAWVSDSDRPAGISMLTPEDQMQLYEHIPNLDEAKSLFREIRDGTESGDHSQYFRVKWSTSVLIVWIESSFSQSWNEIKTQLASIPED